MASDPATSKGSNEEFSGLEQFDMITKARGIVIDYAVQVEQALCEVLSQYVTGGGLKRDKFRTYLQRESFTFGMKIAMLSEFDVHRLRNDSITFKGLTGNLMRVMEVRNSLAHQPRDPMGSYIVVKTSGKTTKTLMDENYVIEFANMCHEITQKLNTLRAMLEAERGPPI